MTLPNASSKADTIAEKKSPKASVLKGSYVTRGFKFAKEWKCLVCLVFFAKKMDLQMFSY